MFCDFNSSQGPLRVSRDKEMLGSYGPKKDSYVCTTPRRGWEEAPAGAMVRGKFKAKSAFLDDDKQKVPLRCRACVRVSQVNLTCVRVFVAS